MTTGMPQATDKRKFITVYMSPRERDYLKHIAKHEDMALTRLCRQLIREALHTRYGDNPPRKH